VGDEKEIRKPKPAIRGLRLVVFAFLPLAIGWLAMECLALLYFWVGPVARRPRPQMIYSPHPYRVYEHIAGRTDESGHASHNSQHLRGRDFAATKPAATVRIVCLGGSTTYSVGATTDTHTYPAHLERLLRAHYAKAGFGIEVINAGHPGYTSLESLILFQTRLLDFSPDVAILHNCLNDSWMATNFQTYASDYSHGRHTFGPLGPRSWEYSPLLSLLFARATTPLNPYAANRMVDLIGLMHTRWGDVKPLDVQARQERTRLAVEVLGRNVLSFVAISRANGVIPILTTETACDAGDFYSQVLAACNDRVRAIAAREAVALVDFAREMPWNPRSFYDVCHLRDRPDGLEHKGRIFANALIGAGVVEQAARPGRR
jgi:lysophospholipase L1-like esterase